MKLLIAKHCVNRQASLVPCIYAAYILSGTDTFSGSSQKPGRINDRNQTINGTNQSTINLLIRSKLTYKPLPQSVLSSGSDFGQELAQCFQWVDFSPRMEPVHNLKNPDLRSAGFKHTLCIVESNNYRALNGLTAYKTAIDNTWLLLYRSNITYHNVNLSEVTSTTSSLFQIARQSKAVKR